LGAHRRFFSSVCCANPLCDLWYGVHEVTRIQRNAGGTIRPKAKRYRDIDSRLIQLKERLTSGSIDVVQYSDAAPHLLHLD
jgi:hypothetical protein